LLLLGLYGLWCLLPEPVFFFIAKVYWVNKVKMSFFFFSLVSWWVVVLILTNPSAFLCFFARSFFLHVLSLHIPAAKQCLRGHPFVLPGRITLARASVGGLPHDKWTTLATQQSNHLHPRFVV
jgi:hypothetical protein